MSYTPPTPTLPEGEEMQKVLDAFGQLPCGPWAWSGYVHQAQSIRRPQVNLMAQIAGQPSLLHTSETEGFLFRDETGYMADANEIAKPQRNEVSVSRLDNPTAIALASAWMVPLLVEENEKLRGQVFTLSDAEQALVDGLDKLLAPETDAMPQAASMENTARALLNILKRTTQNTQC